MSALPPDYDLDPGRWRSWSAPHDVHEMVAPELRGPVLNVGCGDGRLPSLLGEAVRWVGVDSSPMQLQENRYRPVVLADSATCPSPTAPLPRLPTSGACTTSTVQWRYFACTAAQDSDPEILPEGYPPSTFDDEEAESIVHSVFDSVEAQRWDGFFFPLAMRGEVRAYCRHNSDRAHTSTPNRRGSTSNCTTSTSTSIMGGGSAPPKPVPS